MIEVLKETLSAETRSHFGLLAEFSTPRDVYHACEKVRDAGYTKWDAHVPFPVHGLEKAMGLPVSPLPYIVFACGMVGVATALTLQWWTSTVAYPMVISGKPHFSWPAFVPIMFELGVLFGALGALLGMLAINQLPRHHHSLFSSERFSRASDDKFFISIDSTDPKYDEVGTLAFLKSLHPDHVERVEIA
jgi:hypothetical protein